MKTKDELSHDFAAISLSRLIPVGAALTDDQMVKIAGDAYDMADHMIDAMDARVRASKLIQSMAEKIKRDGGSND